MHTFLIRYYVVLRRRVVHKRVSSDARELKLTDEAQKLDDVELKESK